MCMTVQCPPALPQQATFCPAVPASLLHEDPADDVLCGEFCVGVVVVCVLQSSKDCLTVLGK